MPQWYCEVCKPEVGIAWCKRRPKVGTRRLLWHHDNAPAHTAIVPFSWSEGIHILPHPRYSSYLALCDFFLFPKVKGMLKGRDFSSNEVAMDYTFQAMNEEAMDFEGSRPSSRMSGGGIPKFVSKDAKVHRL